MRSMTLALVAIGGGLAAGGIAAQAPAVFDPSYSPPRLPSGKPDLQGLWSNALVTPLGRPADLADKAFLTEEEARAYCKERELPIIGCCCPACGDLSLQRQRVKRLIVELEREHPNVKSSMINALGNVMPRHLLDRRLNPIGEITEAIAAEPALIPVLLNRPS